jgi:hypothetical protein
MARGIRQQEGEDFSPAKVAEIISLLDAEKPITKKDACAKLGMAYNTGRLSKIIDTYKEEQAYHEKRRKELRKQPLTTEDYSYIVSSYLEEANLTIIAETTHRSLTVIKRVLERFNIPLRSSATSYQNPIYLADNSISQEYAKDDLVYSARYDEPAYVCKKLTDETYRIWLLKSDQYSIQPYWELGDLRKIQKELSISISTRKYHDGGELQQAIALAMQNAKKRKK